MTTINISGMSRSPHSFEDVHFRMVSLENHKVSIQFHDGDGVTNVQIPDHLLAMLSWMYLDKYYKSRVIMAGLKSFWDIITIAESRRRIRTYQLTENGFRKVWAKYLNNGEL